jgi:hypothetical protein
MRGPCECCLDNGRVRPMHEYREVKTELGLMAMNLCGPCSSALTVSIARHERESKPIPRTFIVHKDEQGNATAHEVQ